jgi:tetratricopeptide (TPR) repeat protein
MEKMHSHELAERYVLGYLSPEEKEWFEKEMQESPELKKDVALLNGISNAIQDQDLIEFRAMVQEEAAEYKISRRGQKLRRIFVRTSYAAATIILVAATFFVLSIQGHRAVSSAKVFSENYSPYKSGLVSRSGSVSDDELYSRAIRQYAALQYKSASITFDSVIYKDPGNNAALFFAGMAYMEIKEFQKAAQRFEKIIRNDNSLYVEQAEWYRGLSLLAINDRKNALVHFKNLASSKGYYTSKARLVLNELKED